nr:YidB family protein [Ottowia sp.]
MFDVLIREAGARFGLGEKALPLVQMLLAYMTNKANGGLMGFLEKFKAAGFGPIIQSWLGGGPLAQPISNSQLETVLGSSGGLLSLLTSRLGVERDSATSALGYLLPAVVGKLTPGGSIPSSLPPEVAGMAAAGESLMAAPVVEQVAPGGGFMKWLPWIVVAVAVLLGLGYCAKQKTAETTPAAVPAPASAPASDAVRADWGGGAPA